jgi:hypothetical protein
MRQCGRAQERAARRIQAGDIAIRTDRRSIEADRRYRARLRTLEFHPQRHCLPRTGRTSLRSAAERGRTPRDFAADVAKTDDADGLAPDLTAHRAGPVILDGPLS